MATKKETALVAQDNQGFLALANTDFAESIAEELDGLDLTFDRIKIPSGGGITFEVIGEDGEPEPVKEFSAVILHHHALNAYYKTKFTGGNNPPDCSSIDGRAGHGDPGGECQSCPLNEFDTGENGSKACKNRRLLYLIKEGETFPQVLSLPVGSIKEFTNYLKRTLSKGNKSNAVVTRFSLKKATNQGGVVYSQAQFAVDRLLTPDEYALIKNLTEQVKTYSKTAPVSVNAVNIDILVDEETGEVIEPLN
jgi:hypothetical protein